MNSIHNPNCDGAHCRKESGEVRVLPIGSGGNLILCCACHAYEIAYRRERNAEVAAPYDCPAWDSLAVYPAMPAPVPFCGQATVPCQICGQQTPMLGTKLCDRCRELKVRIEADPHLAVRILNDLQAFEDS
jgi:hypothetical protein